MAPLTQNKTHSPTTLFFSVSVLLSAMENNKPIQEFEIIGNMAGLKENTLIFLFVFFVDQLLDSPKSLSMHVFIHPFIHSSWCLLISSC